jgi:hypothetical protein
LADEMGTVQSSLLRSYYFPLTPITGLGKTVQVISFFAHLRESGKKGPHLIVVP